MALAAAVRQLEAAGDVALTNYGEFLAADPPAHEVQIRPRTSWSCAHGIERWRSDCGCRFRSDWHQRWRAPLREALDWLRDQVDLFYEARASAWLKDPWEARDDYVRVVLDRREPVLQAFLMRHRRTELDAGARLEVLRLLELERHRQLMYTSCGWFFDELSGLEPVQILRYAAMALQYLAVLGGGRLEDELVRRLEAAPSNLPEFGDGARVWRRLVAPAVADLHRVVAHYAITGLFEEHPDDARIYAWRVARLDEARDAYGTTALRVARVRVSSEVTGESEETAYAVLHFGGHDFACGVGRITDPSGYERTKADLLGAYARTTLADMVRAMDRHFPGPSYSLTDLFLEERRRVLDNVLRATLDRNEETFRRVWEENRKLVHYLRQADAPIPPALALVARHVFEEEILTELSWLPRLDVPRAIPARVFELAAEAQALGLTIDLGRARPAMREAVHDALARVSQAPGPEAVAEAVGLIEGAGRLGLRYGRWGAQSRFFEVWQARPEAREVLAPLAAVLGFSLAV
jgi:hypothetical protein